MTAVELFLAMRIYTPLCEVWLGNRKVQPTDSEVVDYHAHIAAIFDRERKSKAQRIDDSEDEPPVVATASPMSEPKEQRVATLLFDPKLFESDVDL